MVTTLEREGIGKGVFRPQDEQGTRFVSLGSANLLNIGNTWPQVRGCFCHHLAH